MKTIGLRKFANLNLIEVLDMTERRYRIQVVDDAGEKVITDTWLLAMNWFSLVVHRHFDAEPYCIDEVLVLKPKEGQQAFVDDSKLKRPIDNFVTRLVLKYDTPEFYDLVKQLVYVWHNQLHNFMCLKSETAVVSARSMDILHAYKNPKIAEIRRKVKAREMTIGDALPEFDRVMMTDPYFDKCVFGLLYRTRSVSSIQSFQLVVARGDVTDLNSTILPNTVLNSYGDGITNLADSLADSKGAGFSLISNGAALQNSEWFHKKIHNVAQCVVGVRYGNDCGSTKGAVVRIISNEFRNALQGKWRIKEDGTQVLLFGKELESIKVNDVVKIRSVAWCHHGRTGKPCSRCFGKMESALPYNRYTGKAAVPGLFYGSTFAEPIGQSILKTKHRIGSASTVGYTVDPIDRDFISTDEEGDFIFFNDEILNAEANPYLILDKDTQQDFSDFSFMESLDELDSNRLRTYESITLQVSIPNPMFPDKPAIHKPIINTTVASRDARMTMTFVEYLMGKPIEEDGRTFKISLKDWDSEHPAFELPQVNEDLAAYQQRVENVFSFEEIKNRSDYWIDEERHGELLVGLWKVVDEKYSNANIIIHDIFMYSCMARDPDDLNYGLPAADDPRKMVTLHDSILLGGMGNALLYGYQRFSLLQDPSRYLIKNRKGGPLNSFLSVIAS